MRAPQVIFLGFVTKYKEKSHCESAAGDFFSFRTKYKYKEKLHCESAAGKFFKGFGTKYKEKPYCESAAGENF